MFFIQFTYITSLYVISISTCWFSKAFYCYLMTTHTHTHIIPPKYLLFIQVGEAWHWIGGLKEMWLKEALFKMEFCESRKNKLKKIDEDWMTVLNIDCHGDNGCFSGSQTQLWRNVISLPFSFCVSVIGKDAGALSVWWYCPRAHDGCNYDF